MKAEIRRKSFTLEPENIARIKLKVVEVGVNDTRAVNLTAPAITRTL